MDHSPEAPHVLHARAAFSGAWMANSNPALSVAKAPTLEVSSKDQQPGHCSGT